MQSLRLASGHEALVARVLTDDGRTAFGFSLRLDGTEARHMAEFHAGARDERPAIEPVIAHPWETAYIAGSEIPWNAEAGFAALRWLPRT